MLSSSRTTAEPGERPGQNLPIDFRFKVDTRQVVNCNQYYASQRLTNPSS
jgi:hypothetical protein